MSLNQTPSADRIHIGIFGRRNAGKSSLLNAILDQPLAVVSEVRGTTTDPVRKAMELLPLGPVMLIDTPGLDDEGTLGAERVKKSLQVLDQVDAALVVIDSTAGVQKEERALVASCEKKGVPVVVILNKSECLTDTNRRAALKKEFPDALWMSAKTGENIGALKERLAALPLKTQAETPLLSDLLAPLDLVVLVVPIDKAAPKGRLILPQQQAIRDLLDHGMIAAVCREHELPKTLSRLGKPPALVVTDSQVFNRVNREVPPDIPLTSFSILFARKKGILRDAVTGVKAVDTLREGDRVLICEGCTHHRQCDDIGSVKLPRWITEHVGGAPAFSFASGTGFPEDLHDYKLVVHCGGCMLQEREVLRRLSLARSQGIPMTNYGILIAYLNGILKRSVGPFGEIAALL